MTSLEAPPTAEQRFLEALLAADLRFLKRIKEVQADPSYPLAFREGECVKAAQETQECITQLEKQIAEPAKSNNES